MVKQYRVLISTEAQNSLTYIVDYLIEKHSLQTGLKKERQLLEAIQTLKTFPQGHSQHRIKRKKRTNPYRFLPIENYKIIYTVEEEPDAIVIVIQLIHDNMSMKNLEKILP